MGCHSGPITLLQGPCQARHQHQPYPQTEAGLSPGSPHPGQRRKEKPNPKQDRRGGGREQRLRPLVCPQTLTTHPPGQQPFSCVGLAIERGPATQVSRFSRRGPQIPPKLGHSRQHPFHGGLILRLGWAQWGGSAHVMSAGDAVIRGLGWAGTCRVS